MANKGSFNIDTGNFTYEIPEKTEISGISEISGNNLGESLFEDIGKERIESLKRSITELNKLIVEREKLSKEIVKEAEILKTEINNFLLENENIELEDHDAMIERNNLRAKKMSVSELQLREKIDSWKDISTLKRERRIYEQELSEKENRVKALNKILEES
jgi:Fe-S cluster biosynthesis and repair protein YggX